MRPHVATSVFPGMNQGFAPFFMRLFTGFGGGIGFYVHDPETSEKARRSTGVNALPKTILNECDNYMKTGIPEKDIARYRVLICHYSHRYFFQNPLTSPSIRLPCPCVNTSFAWAGTISMPDRKNRSHATIIRE
ncbi:MAG: hypothetical protein JJK57_05410 [Komagataeibacter hansenii]|nr:hypothetical protein [Novacetimonas hansenii]